uniref:Probable palmitoyltransferase ZDHHC14 n=1 Tax=Sinocyclocheilus grahami TaxID=75366 RepID=A0A672KB54_SINGR
MKNCEYQQIDPRALGTSNTRTSTTFKLPKNSQRLRRKWEVFPGNNRFYCDGRIMLARQCGVLPLTIGLIVITSGLFFTFDCPFLVHHLTVFIPVIGGMLFVFVIFTLLQTSFTEPGILPRALPDEAADVERQIDNSGSSTYRPPPRTKEILINDQVQICNLNPSCTIVELVICFFSIWSVLGLSGFHTYLVAANLTTNEDIKGSWSSKRGEESGNPYTYNNIFTNCCVVLCGPMPPSLIDRRGFLPPDDTPQTVTSDTELPPFMSKNDANMVRVPSSSRICQKTFHGISSHTLPLKGLGSIRFI